MLEDLFITDAPGEVSNSGVELSDDMANWPMEVQSIIISQIPALMNIPGQLNFDAVEQDKRYAKGSYVVQIGASHDNAVVIPVVIKSGELAPIDLYIYNGKWHPLDNDELQGLLTSPEIGSGLMDEADIPPTAYSGMMNRMGPPGAYSGMVTSVASKMAALDRKTSDDLISKVQNTPALLRKLALNKTAKKRFTAILDCTDVEKAAAATLPGSVVFGGDRVVYALGNGKFTVKSAVLHVADNIVGTNTIECDGDQLLTWAKEAGIDYVKMIADLKRDKMAFNWDDTKPLPEEDILPISKCGSYTCYDSESLTPESVTVLGVVKTAGGDNRFLAIGTNGEYFLQRDVIGKPSSTVTKVASRPEFELRTGATITMGLNSTEKIAEYAPPTKLTGVTTVKLPTEDLTVLSGTSCRGKMAYVITSDSRVKSPIRTKHLPQGCMVDKTAEVWYIPTGHPIIELNGTPKSLIKTAWDLKSAVRLNGGSHSPLVTLRMWEVGRDAVGIKIGSAEPKIIDKTSALLLVKEAQGSKVMDTMSKMAGGEIQVLEMVSKKNGAKYLKSKAKDLGVRNLNINPKPASALKKNAMSNLKVAAALEEEEAIDTVLGLNYLTPDNMSEFASAIPDMKATEEALAKLLMSVRLGNAVAEEQDVKNVLTSLHGIIKSLEGGM